MRARIVLGISVVAGLAIAVGQMTAVGGGSSMGPDVVYTDCQSVTKWGEVGGIVGYSMGTNTCNNGDQDLEWGTLYNGTPVMGMNAYRLHNGRLIQIGMSWAKNATAASASSGCAGVCNGHGGSVLGIGCRDVYSSTFNGIQSILQARSEINAFTGEMLPAPGGSGDAVFRRLQIESADMSPVTYPNALYFIEGVYIATDEGPTEALNNASHKRVTVLGDQSMFLAGPIQPSIPAIQAWYDHGNGVDTPDESVEIVTVDVPNEGRFYAAARVSDNGDGTWHYEYAVFNFNSHRSADRFIVANPAGSVVTNIGFHDVDYHSGEVYDNTDWTVTEATSLTWQSPETFAQNPDTNALRWGTMYNFWFDSTWGPGSGTVRIGLFRPGTPDTIGATLPIPAAAPPCDGDCADPPDGIVDVLDLLALLGQWGAVGTSCDPEGDGVDVVNLLELLAEWGPCL